MPDDSERKPTDPELKKLVRTILQPAHILLLEDDKDMALLMQKAAADYDCILTTVQSQKDALTSLGAGKFDLVFLDVNLPHGGSGIEVYRAMVANSWDYPVCIFSGQLTQAHIAAVTDIGSPSFMEKPKSFTQDNLRRIFRTYGIREKKMK